MDFALPQIGEGVYEAEFVRWLVEPGTLVKRGQTLLEVMTDKATMEVPSPFIGTIGSLNVEPGQTIKVGQVILSYTPAETNSAQAPEPRLASTPTLALAKVEVTRPRNGIVPEPAPLSVKASPAVRYLARKLGVDLTGIQGSGPEGRILIEDVGQRIQPALLNSPPRLSAGPDYGKPGTRIKLQGLRRKIAEHMVHSKRTIPHYSYIDECEVTDLVHLRNSLKERFAQGGVKLTYLAFLVKAVVAGLRAVPLVNASLNEDDGEIVLHDRYNIGIAVAAPLGLIVPVVRDADKKDLSTIARDIDRLTAEARAGKSKRDDLRGGTFTLTSVGNIGGLISTPVINHPEVGILGIGKVIRRPVYGDDGQIRPADLVYLSASFDHRVVDGAVGAAFTNVVLDQLRNPALLLLPETI